MFDISFTANGRTESGSRIHKNDVQTVSSHDRHRQMVCVRNKTQNKEGTILAPDRTKDISLVP